MKNRKCWLMISLMALGVAACKKKEEAAAPESQKPSIVEQAVEKAAEILTPPPKVASLSMEERAAKLGFAKYLGTDTDYLVSFYNGTKTADRVKATKLWKLVQKQLGGGLGMGAAAEEPAPDAQEGDAAMPTDAAMDPEEIGPALLFGSEFTVAMGKPTGVQVGHLVKLNSRMTYFQMRGLAKAVVAAAKDGDADSLAQAMGSGYSVELLGDILKDPESGIELVEAMKMPPLTFAFRVAPSKVEGASQQVAGMLTSLNMLGEMVEPVEAEKAGRKFQGLKISGEKLAKTLGENREAVGEMLEPEMVDRLLAAVAKNDIVIASGTVGEYVVIFIGSSLDELVLAEDLGKSLVAGEQLAFFDAYASKELSALIYADKAASDAVYSSLGGLADITNGLRDGIAGSEGLGDTRDLEAMFQIVADREAALKKLASNEAQGTVAFFEEGLKIESYGGMDAGTSDWKKSNKLAHLGSSSDVVLFANMNVTDEYDQKSREYFEALLETAYGITMKVAELPMKDEQFTQFAGMAKMYDEQFRGDTVALWQAFSGEFGQGLGAESALIVDLKGVAPAIPGVPQKVVDEAKVPRITVISPVVDRAKLAASWDKMNTTTTKILGQVSQMMGQDIPMQKPLSSEKNDLITWFFPFPFINDDFLPSVTVGDEWFAASTSKNQALDLINQAKAGGEAGDGFTLTLNFKALEAYAKDTAKLVDENAETMMGEALTPEQKKLIEEGIDVMSEFDNLKVHSRREASVLRSSVHFKTRATTP